MADPGARPRTGVWSASILIVLAVLARLAVMLPGLGSPPEDPDNYLPLARAILDGQGLSFQGTATAYRPPLYPLVLAVLASLPGVAAEAWGVRALHLLLGGATVWLTYLIARRWGYTSFRSAVAAGIVALDPVLVAQSRSVMTETLAAFLLALAVFCLSVDRRLQNVALGGSVLGLAALCRPSLLAIAMLSTIATVLCSAGGPGLRLGRGAVLALATLITLTPWAARNWRLFGEPVWTTTHGGYTLALANNAAYYDAVLGHGSGTVWSGSSQAQWWEGVKRLTRGMSEPQANRALQAAAVEVAIERPRDFARATVARLGRFWGLSPSEAVYPLALRYATALWTTPLWIALLVGLSRRGLWGWPQVVAPVALLALTAVHAFYWTDLRMRAPIVPMIALIAAGATVPCSQLRKDAQNLPNQPNRVARG